MVLTHIFKTYAYELHTAVKHREITNVGHYKTMFINVFLSHIQLMGIVHCGSVSGNTNWVATMIAYIHILLA